MTIVITLSAEQRGQAWLPSATIRVNDGEVTRNDGPPAASIGEATVMLMRFVADWSHVAMAGLRAVEVSHE